MVLGFVFLKTFFFWNLFPMLHEQHICKAKHFLDIFLIDSSPKVLVLPPRRHTGAANNARTSHFFFACSPRSLTWIFNASHALMTGLQHDRDA